MLLMVPSTNFEEEIFSSPILVSVSYLITGMDLKNLLGP